MLWATRRECQMTNRSAGEIIERVYLSGLASEQQLKQVRHSLSYSYYKNKYFMVPSEDEVGFSVMPVRLGLRLRLQT